MRMIAHGMAAICVLSIGVAHAADLLPIQSGQRIVFLGDSITQGGAYVEYFDAYVRTRFPGIKAEIIPLGLSSETTSGLSEEGHPFPRPWVHDRIDRALSETQPNVVSVCYGMNDGIYHPLSDDRFEAYKKGITQAIAKIEAVGSRAVLLTPPPFDPLAKKPEQLTDAAPFGYGKTYRGYNDVLIAYGKWETTLTRRGYVVGDTNGRMMRYLNAIRVNEPNFLLARDGVHPGPIGHWLMAESLLLAWSLPAQAPVEINKLQNKNGELHVDLLSHLPMPRDPRWDHPVDLSNVSRYQIAVPQAVAARYQIYEGDTLLGEAAGRQIAAGLDLMKLEKLSTHARALELLKGVQKMHSILRPAWLAHVGHKRPGPKPKIELPQATKMAAELDPRLRRLAQPVMLNLRLVPVK